ncbi:MAG: 3-keto-5-aminohexanoate cleavage protein, partial [Rhodothermia bacterium]|nr:3-keto-5-aminohexanoate cleavage protein [Rhodothermia bacterium]
MFYGSDKLIINVALTGMVPTKADNRYVPISPNEIADDVARCADMGATIFHIHARDCSERPTHEPHVFHQILAAVRERTDEPLILCVSTSGRVLNTYESRSAVLDLAGEFDIDMASLTLGSLNFPRQASITDPDMIRSLATKMREEGVVPELEIFDAGMLNYSKYLISKSVLSEPLYYNILLGSLGSAPADPRTLIHLVEE